MFFFLSKHGAALMLWEEQRDERTEELLRC
jgi:hypothetical protein